MQNQLKEYNEKYCKHCELVFVLEPKYTKKDTDVHIINVIENFGLNQKAIILLWVVIFGYTKWVKLFKYVQQKLYNISIRSRYLYWLGVWHKFR